MRSGDLAALFVVGLVTASFASVWVDSPGYMDADYYYATAKGLVAGEGFSEPFLWNYLDDPADLPHPSHQYWMPLPSLVAAASMRLLGSSFNAARAPFVLITSMLSILTARLAFELTRDRGMAWQSGLLAAFSGLFLPFMVTTDSFALFALIGGVSFWLLSAGARRPGGLPWLAAGLAAGLGNLARADGALLLGIGVIAGMRSRWNRVTALGWMSAGYLLVMLPWWARNLSVSGSIVNPGSVRLLWMLSYDDLFAFPPDQLTFQRWWEAGLGLLAKARISALGWNSARLLAENGLVFLAPFMLLGARRLWSRPLARLPIYYLGILFAVMSIVFPYLGPRGAFFHSSMATMPVLWALAPVGLRAAIEWAGVRRNWDPVQAYRVLGPAAVGLAAALTIGLFVTRIVLPAQVGRGWGEGLQTYIEARRQFSEMTGRVAVNNPPGLNLATGLEAVVIPDGPPEALRQVVSKFNVDWILLEANHPSELNSLYSDPNSLAWLSLIDTFEDPSGQPVHLLQVNEG